MMEEERSGQSYDGRCELPMYRNVSDVAIKNYKRQIWINLLAGKECRSARWNHMIVKDSGVEDPESSFEGRT